MSEKSYIARSRRRFIIAISVFVVALLFFPLLIFLKMPSPPAPAVSPQGAVPPVADSPKSVGGKISGGPSRLPITEAGP